MITPEFYFYLKDINAPQPTLIYLQSRFNGERLMLTCGEKVLPTHWDFLKKRAVVSKNRVEYSAINDWLDKIEMAAKDFFRDCRYRGELPTAINIKAYLEQKFNLNPKPIVIEPKKKVHTLLSFIESFKKESISRVSLGTIKTYTSTQKHLENYCKTISKSDLAFEEIDSEFYHTFKQYLYSLNHAENTVAKQIKNIKLFLGEATERGINSNMFFRSKSFKKPTEDVDKIYLTDTEIENIYNLDLSGKENLETTRDLFVIACYTGFRFSDFTSLRKEHIGEQYIIKKTLKTKAKVIIPIHHTVKKILQKYQYNLPQAATNQHLNRQLKEIAEMAGICSDVEIIKKLGGEFVRNVYKKYELLSSHTGRRSFATNAYLAGVPTISIMYITGHSTESAFMSYICIDELKNAEHIQSHPFFNAGIFNVAA